MFGLWKKQKVKASFIKEQDDLYDQTFVVKWGHINNDSLFISYVDNRDTYDLIMKIKDSKVYEGKIIKRQDKRRIPEMDEQMWNYMLKSAEIYYKWYKTDEERARDSALELKEAAREEEEYKEGSERAVARAVYAAAIKDKLVKKTLKDFCENEEAYDAPSKLDVWLFDNYLSNNEDERNRV